jgi:hypothetical protein
MQGAFTGVNGSELIEIVSPWLSRPTLVRDWGVSVTILHD